MSTDTATTTDDTVSAPEHPMQRYFNETKALPAVGDLVEGQVISLEPGTVYVNLVPFGTGIIYGREYINARDIIKKTSVGDIISAKVIDPENTDGYIELSLKEARQAAIWTEAEEAVKNKTIIEVLVKDANKGGLIINWQGMAGFLPAL